RARHRAGAGRVLRRAGPRLRAPRAGAAAGGLRGRGSATHAHRVPGVSDLASRIEAAFAAGQPDPDAVEQAIALLDRGELRVAERNDDGWVVNEWAKQAILMYFQVRQMATIEVGPYEYHDKIPLKSGWEALGVRVVPPATARRGAFISPGTVLMPSY